MSEAKNKLPPIADETFDGDKQSVELVENRCEHKETRVTSSTELKCKCGAVWTGGSIVDLHNLLNSRIS